MKKLLNKERLCTVATIIYHCLFLSGASFYITEFQKTRDTIIQQVDRVEKKANELKTTGNEITKSINSVEDKLNNVKRVCEKLRF